MYTTNNYPTDWKHSYIHFVKKQDGKSVRPIILTSCLYKLFETLVKNRLQYWTEHNNLLPANQTGFLALRVNPVDNLVNLTYRRK